MSFIQRGLPNREGGEVMKTGCCICGGVIDKHYTPEGKMYWDKGHNPYPVAVDVNGDAIDTEHEDYRCCDVCNAGVVIPARMEGILLARSKK